jgi:hypothetical protein
VQVSDGSVSKLKKVVITVVSKDQGWSSYPDDHGTYRNVGPGSRLFTALDALSFKQLDLWQIEFAWHVLRAPY